MGLRARIPRKVRKPKQRSFGMRRSQKNPMQKVAGQISITAACTVGQNWTSRSFWSPAGSFSRNAFHCFKERAWNQSIVNFKGEEIQRHAFWPNKTLLIFEHPGKEKESNETLSITSNLTLARAFYLSPGWRESLANSGCAKDDPTWRTSPFRIVPALVFKIDDKKKQSGYWLFARKGPHFLNPLKTGMSLNRMVPFSAKNDAPERFGTPRSLQI